MMIDPSLWTTLPLLIAHLGLGLVLGAGYFFALRRSVDSFADGGGAVRVLALSLLRLLALGAALALVSREGALPLLITALGIFIARFIMMRKAVAAHP